MTIEIDLTKSDPVEVDVELLDTQSLPSLGDNSNKRPGSEVKVTKTPKRAKLNSVTPNSTPSQARVGPSQSATPTPTQPGPPPLPALPSGLVQLKGNKFVVQQKELDWTTKPSYALDVAAFTSTILSQSELKPEEWPSECFGIVAKLVHESDKSEQQTGRTTRDRLIKMIESAVEEDDSQNEVVVPAPAERVPFGPLKALIDSLADRVNYGLDVSDLPDGLPLGVEAIPAGLQIWRWEVKDEALWPKELKSKLDKRKAERAQIKSDAVDAFLALSPSEQSALLAGAKKASAPSTNGADPTASTSSPKPTPTSKPGPAQSKADTPTPKPKKVKVEKVKTAEELAAEADKAKEKAEKEAEKEAKRKEREDKAAERAAEKEKKEDERRKKEAEKKKKEDEKAEKEQKIKDEAAKKESLANKQKSLMSSFLTKKSTPTTPAAVQVSPTNSRKEGKSDFETVFLPFMPGKRIIAPYNRFRDDKRPKPKPLVNSLPNLDPTQAIAELLSTVPARRRLPRDNAHIRPRVSVRDLVTELNESVAMGADSQRDEILKQLQSRTEVQIKHLQFREDVRPGYVGTWTKRSKLIGPRTPFERDSSTLNYEVDSEEEWEEEPDDPDAEAIGDEEEEEPATDAESDVDSWLADDEEPLEYEEGFDGGSPPPMDMEGEDEEEAGFRTAKARLEHQKKKRSAEDGAKKKKLVGKLVPVQLGPHWEEELGTVTQPLFASHRVQFINDWIVGLNPMTHVTKSFLTQTTKPPVASTSTAPAELSTTPAVSAAVVGTTKDPKPLSVRKVALQNKGFSEQHWPAFVRLVHRSQEVGPVLEATLFKQIHAVDPTIKKVEIKAAFSSGAHKNKGRGSVWMCRPELVEKWAPELVKAEGEAEGSPPVAVAVAVAVTGGEDGAGPMVID